jgi:arsenite methyltransferase
VKKPDDFLTYDDLPLWSAPFGLTLLDAVKLTHPLNVLDIGSGGGFPMLELAERLGASCTVYGVDPSPDAGKMIRMKGRLKEIKNVKMIKCGAEKLPFENDFFGLIISNNGLNNVKDPVKVLKESYRTGKKDCQMVLTMNLPHTFIEFYDVFEDVLSGTVMIDEIGKMHDHIDSKRKPVEWWKNLISENGFMINSINLDGFKYRYSNGTAFLNHYLIRKYFMPSWKAIIPFNSQELIFSEIEIRLNELSRQNGVLEMSVPFVCFDCYKL